MNEYMYVFPPIESIKLIEMSHNTFHIIEQHKHHICKRIYCVYINIDVCLFKILFIVSNSLSRILTDLAGITNTLLTYENVKYF